MPKDNLLAEYPHIRFEKHWTIGGELNYQLGQCDAMAYAISRAPLLPQYREKLHIVSMQKGAQATTAIEGNTLTDEEVERVFNREELEQPLEYQQQEVANILDAFNTLGGELIYREHVEFVSEPLLLRLHAMVGKDLGERFHAVPGRFAQARRRVGPYRAPAHEDVPDLIRRACEWLRREFHFPEQRFSDAVIQAIVTHVYIEWIHPFDDGNGRTGRLVEFYILLRGGLPSIASHLLANHYNNTRPEYYRQLQLAKTERDLSSFIAYAVSGLRDGLRRAVDDVQQNALEQMWRVLVYERFGQRQMKQRESFTRQRAVALALPLDRPIRFAEVRALTPELAAAYENASDRRILRDLAVIEKLGLILRTPGLVQANGALLDGTRGIQRRIAAPD